MSEEISPRTQCPECAKNGGDGKNLAHYADGGTYCHKCGTPKGKYSNGLDLVSGTLADLSHRRINKETTEKYRVREKLFTGYINKDFPQVVNERVMIYPFTENGKVVAQLIRSVNIKKAMGFRGKKVNQLWGMDKFNPSKQWPVIVTEGHDDAMAAYQMTGTNNKDAKYKSSSIAAVSVPKGAGNAHQAILDNLPWLAQWKEILICFDSDEAGRMAAEKCIGECEPGTVRNISLPLKDAGDMLKEGRIEEFKKAVWNAERIRPSTIVFPEDIRDKIFTPPEFGSPWPWPSMTKATYGRRKGELYLLAAATSIGKTEIVREIVFHLLENGEKAGVFSLEQQPEQTMQRYIGSAMGQRLYLPGCEGWDEAVMQVHYDKFARNIALYQPCSGILSLDALLTNIRWLNKSEGMEFFVIDNLKALATNPQIEGKKVALHDYLSFCQGAFFTIVRQLNINIFVLNHLAEDKIAKQAYVSISPKNRDEYLDRTSEEMQKFINRPGMTWETGRMPSIENIFGGGNIKDLTDYILVASRNRMSEDYDEHRTIKMKFLKTRLDSTYEGFQFLLRYNYTTGRLEESYDKPIDNSFQS